MVTKLKFKEVSGECISIGTMVVEHEFSNTKDLIRYIKENWFDLENAVKVDSIEFEFDTEGDFLLTINELKDE